ncbi:MAG TPA: proton-conducting transporter membrane subunit [Candidatus Hydrogenedentes bacterium]|nr:proton-conducting transporter membrane subunit [Candidatus Hydrogenedentota bacterium]
MDLFLASVILLVATGILAGLSGRCPNAPARIAFLGMLGSAALASAPCIDVLFLGGAPETLHIPWDVPGGAFSLRLDALSAFFILPMLLISSLCALYGLEYMRAHLARRSVAAAWCFFNVLVASMMMVVVAHNAVLFLVAWEVMALASFFLVAFEDEKGEVRTAAWVYLIATHLGTAALLAMFAILGGPNGFFDFDAFGHGIAPGATAAVFLLAVVGFGAKAGFAPFHVWLPEAHPAAPSHVSALMSGLMIKTGIYGLLRIVMHLGPPPLWWGWTLLAIGLFSGIGGVLFALAQHDLKRLLAYHSVENIGIIAIGLGLGFAGWSSGLDVVCVLGFGGALLHVLNHSLFKSLLFLGAGSVLHATHTRDMDHLGGLLKRMPHTGGTFLIGSMAISGLPPFNGFVSEFLIFLGALHAIVQGNSQALLPSIATVTGLALISGLAAACFTKAFGGVFLGEPRSGHTQHAHDPGWRMRAPMWTLAGACLAIGLGAPWVAMQLSGTLTVVRPDLARSLPMLLQSGTLPLHYLVLTILAFLALVGTLAFLRSQLLRGRTIGESCTWDCGYAAPTARMQYTASSFAQPLTRLFHKVLGTQRCGDDVAGIFPASASISTVTPDVCAEKMYRPLFSGIEWMVLRLRWLQHGNIHLYVLYIAVTLLVLLIWKLN